MEHRQLGSSGTRVSTLCLGTMTFGEPDEKSMMHGIASDEATAFRVADRSVDAGINFFDTADVYGNDGLSERVVGKWLAQTKKREQVVLATKFRFRMQPDTNGTGGSRRYVTRACEASLRRLGTDRIDLYQIHMQDDTTPEEETLRALDDLVTAGKVVYVGASNYAAYRLVESLLTSRQRGWAGYVALQAQYSLVHRELEREHVPACARFGVGILPWSPLAGGFLSGKYQKDAPAPAGTRLDKWKERLAGFGERHWRIIDAVRGVATELGSTPSAVSLAWLLRKRAVTSVIFGARTVAQLEDNLAGASLELPDAAVKRLDDASAFDLGYPYEMIGRIQGGRW